MPRYECVNDLVGCHKSDRKAVKCGYCGGQVFAYEGVYGVFHWRSDGRYKLEDAVRTYKTRAAADRFIGSQELVSRWIPKPVPPKPVTA